MPEHKKQPRKYTGPTQYFHNFEHDPDGLNHCKSEGQYPYQIEHVDGKHKISAKIAIGHGKGNKPQAFEFSERLGDGWDLASGKPIEPKTIELSLVKDAHNSHAIRIDRSIEAKEVVTRGNKKGVKRWRSRPDQMDVRGVDTPRNKQKRPTRATIDRRGKYHKQRSGMVL